jgi:hypothetical protein
MCQEIVGRELAWSYDEQSRTGDHIWWVSDLSRFMSHYPAWQPVHDVPSILRQINGQNRDRWNARAKVSIASSRPVSRPALAHWGDERAG